MPDSTGDQRAAQRAALQESLRATTRIEAKGEPKIGIDEFMSVCERFGLSRSALAQIRAVVEKEDWGAGPFLANYYSNLSETKVQAYERAAREIFGVDYAIAVSSGTGALHAAMVGVGVKAGAEVICPAIGFFATANTVALCGGTPVFCDVDESLHMDPAKIEPLVTSRTVAVAPTCVMGGIYDIGAIMEVAGKHGLKVVEDCAQSCGATYKGKYAGAFGDYGCFSISAYKVVGGGEGGLLLAKTEELWERASQVIECGGLWRPDRFAPSRYEGELFPGTNYRMSELEAAVDVVQLGKMPAAVARFRTAKRRILERLERFREIAPQRSNDPGGEVGYTLRFFPETRELSELIVEGLQAAQLNASTRGKQGAPDWHIYSYMYPLQDQCRIHRGDCPIADEFFDRMVSVGVNQWYTEDDCLHVAERINTVLGKYCTPDANAKPWL